MRESVERDHPELAPTLRALLDLQELLLRVSVRD
jgi:hypothetical protein